MTEFKVGDRIRCIHPTERGYIKQGKEYVVMDFMSSVSGGQKVWLRENPSDGLKFWIMSWRFELVKEKPMKKTIKQAEYGDEIVRIDGNSPDMIFRFIGVHPDSPSRIIYSTKSRVNNGRVNNGVALSMKSSRFFNTFKLKPQERWVLVGDPHKLRPNQSARGPFSSMEKAIEYAEYYCTHPSKWEAVKLEDSSKWEAVKLEDSSKWEAVKLED